MKTDSPIITIEILEKLKNDYEDEYERIAFRALRLNTDAKIELGVYNGRKMICELLINFLKGE